MHRPLGNNALQIGMAAFCFLEAARRLVHGVREKHLTWECRTASNTQDCRLLFGGDSSTKREPSRRVGCMWVSRLMQEGEHL